MSFEFDSDEPGSTFEARLTPGSDWRAATSPFTADLSAGSYTFQVRRPARPASGPDPVTVNFVEGKDGPPPPPPPGGNTDPPETSYTGDPAEGATVPEGPVSFEFDSDRPGSTFEARLTQVGLAGGDKALVTADLSAGSYTFQVRATDPAGNVDQTQ